ncbi:MAG: type II secretion system F family protein [Spirochaetales bacterium]|nr:type II secretion system F family protein [Spirochaetales bacterium]
MAVFKCKVVDNEGKTHEMVKESSSEDVLTLELMQKNFYPVKIKMVGSSEGEGSGGKRFKRNAIIEFTETLALLLNAGLQLKDAIEISKTIFTKGPLHELSTTILDKINKGSSFHKTLQDYRGSFPPIYSGLVKIGQKIGSLQHIFERLALYLEEDKKIREKVVNALMYPVMILGFTVLTMFAMVLFIFPNLKNTFAKISRAMAERMSETINTINMVFIVIGGTIIVITIAVVIILFIRRQGGAIAEQLDRILLKLPFVGKIVGIREFLNFLFAMETLTGSGFAVEDALPEAAMVFNNQALKSSVELLREKIIKGDHLSTAFLDDPLFDERIGRWVSIGERSGNIEIVFGQLRNFYQDEMNKWSVRFMGIIEPALTIVVGIILTLFLLMFFVPIYSMYQDLLKH